MSDICSSAEAEEEVGPKMSADEDVVRIIKDGVEVWKKIFLKKKNWE